MIGRTRSGGPRQRYGVATLGVAFVLVFYVSLSWLELNALKNNTTYASAFYRLLEATSHLELEIHRSFDHARGTARQSRSDELQQTFEELLIIFSALRAADEDGISSETEAAHGESDEHAWDRLTHALDVESTKELWQMELGERTMPDHLVRIWEESPDRSDSLESMIGDLIEQSDLFVGAQGVYGEPERRALIKLERLMDERIHPAFHMVSMTLEEESRERTNLIFAILLISAFAIAVVALINLLAVYAPLEQDPGQSGEAPDQAPDSIESDRPAA